MTAVTGIDHAIVGVRDLEQARAAWQRLGFAVTPRGRHVGWGTANYCIMFPADYVELLGIVDPAQDLHGLDAFLADREGVLALALAAADADAAHAQLRDAGVAAEPPQDLARILDLPEGEVRPAFRVVHPAATAALGQRLFVCQHLTPELMRRPGWLRHANGARRLVAVTAAVADPAALEAAYHALFGGDAVSLGDDGLTVRMGSASCYFGPAEPGVEGMLGIAVEVADLEAAADILARAGIRWSRSAGRVDVDPRDATGVALSLVAG